MLKEYNLDFFKTNLCPPDNYRPFPQASERAAWENLLKYPLNRERAAWLKGKAEALHPENWQVLPATVYMQYQRCGNRSNYEDIYFQRRRELGILVITECLELQGRFIDAIINAIWAILEEMTWCIPAHHPCFENDPLPRNDQEIVDLFAAETAMVLAESYYLLKERLDQDFPSLCGRIKTEINRRVIEPVLVDQGKNFWWFKGTNNWAPWCASNVLGAGLYVLEDREKQAGLAESMTQVVDRYLAGVPSDGGCDEGVTYWGVAAGATLLFLEILHSATDGKIDIFQNPLIIKMGEFIDNAHLTGPWFSGFADSSPKQNMRRAIVYRYGHRINSESLKNLALLESCNWNPDNPVQPLFRHEFCGASINSIVRELFWMPANAIATPQEMPLNIWLPELQFMVARDRPDGNGFTVAAKAGHNAENHNHNDVGQFILYYNQEPLIVDIGVQEYTRATFSMKRYTLEPIRGRGHNVPVINGFEQLSGREYEAEAVKFEKGAATRLSMSLRKAYAPEAEIRKLQREVRLEPGVFTITDTFEITGSNPKTEIILNMYSPAVLSHTPGELRFNNQARMNYDPEILLLEVIKTPLEDRWLRHSWGSSINKLIFSYKGSASGTYQFKFTPI